MRLVLILSIKPRYAEAILSKVKTVEFRKASFPKNANIAIVYSSNHVARIVGWFRIKKVVTMNPADAWKKYQACGAITKPEFDRYYTGAKEAVCLEIGAVHKVDPPIDPYANIRGFRPPQSFRYLKMPDFNGLMDQMAVLRNRRLVQSIGIG